MQLGILARRVPVCTPDTHLRTVVRVMALGDYDVIPVVESWAAKRPVGVVRSTGAIRRFVAEKGTPSELQALDAMEPLPPTAPAATSADDAHTLLVHRRAREVVVVDAGGRYLGLASAADLGGTSAPA